MGDNFIPGDPSRLRGNIPRETPDGLGVFGPSEGSLPHGNGALDVPGVLNIAQTQQAKKELAVVEQQEPKKLTKAQLKKRRIEALAKAREVRKAKRSMKTATSFERSAAAQASVQGSPTIQTKPVMTQTPKLTRMTDAWTIELPEITMSNMQDVERSIIEGRRKLDAYAKEAQKLAMSSRDRRCEFCKRVIPEGKWYSRDCPVDPNGNLKWDRVWCSQPCDIQSKLAAQNEGQGALPEGHFYNLGIR